MLLQSYGLWHLSLGLAALGANIFETRSFYNNPSLGIRCYAPYLFNGKIYTKEQIGTEQGDRMSGEGGRSPFSQPTIELPAQDSRLPLSTDRHRDCCSGKGLYQRSDRLLRLSQASATAAMRFGYNTIEAKDSENMDINRVLKNRDEILQLAAKYGAYNVRIFGSVARGEADADSDVDFLVDMEPGKNLTSADSLWICKALAPGGCCHRKRITV